MNVAFVPRTLRRLALAASAAGLLTAAPASAATLTFGIYPGGGAGTVGASGRTLPENATLRMQALQTLRAGSRAFVLHLYDDFRTRSDAAAVPSWLSDQISGYSAGGFQIELVLRYRPSDPAGDVAGYTDFVRSRVRQLGGIPGFVGLQVTNEANVTVAPDAADGAYSGARDALVSGVIAAHDEAAAHHFSQLQVGFNWASAKGPRERDFWSSLRRIAGGRSAAFRRAVDWVGLDSYPGTWGPWQPAATLAKGAQRTTTGALDLLSRTYLPLAGLRGAHLHLSEVGYPTGPGRPDSAQQSVLSAVTKAVTKLAKRYRITGYRWFDLRDADSSSLSFESQYGLMRDDYTPKPAFNAYRTLIRRLSR